MALRLREASAPRKSSKLSIALVPPVELLVVALEEAELAGKLPFLARGEGDVQRGGAEPVGQRRRGLEQERLALALGPVRHARAGAGR